MLRIRFYFKPEELQCLAELQTEQPKPRKVEGPNYDMLREGVDRSQYTTLATEGPCCGSWWRG